MVPLPTSWPTSVAVPVSAQADGAADPRFQFRSDRNQRPIWFDLHAPKCWRTKRTSMAHSTMVRSPSRPCHGARSKILTMVLPLEDLADVTRKLSSTISARAGTHDSTKQSYASPRQSRTKDQNCGPDVRNRGPAAAATTRHAAGKPFGNQIVAGLWLKCGAFCGAISSTRIAVQNFSGARNPQGTGLSRPSPNRFALRDVFLKKHR